MGNVSRGKVIKGRKGYAVQVGGMEYTVPKGCDPIIDPYLGPLAGEEVEVLLAGKEILAIRAQKELARELEIPPIITCYLLPPDVVFSQRIMKEVAPIITKALIESEYLEKDVAMQLEKWQQV